MQARFSRPVIKKTEQDLVWRLADRKPVPPKSVGFSNKAAARVARALTDFSL